MNDNTSAFCASKYDEEIRKVLPYYEDFYKQVVDIVKVWFDRTLDGNEYFPISIIEHLDLLRQCGFERAEVLWVSNMQVGLLGIKS